MKFDQPFISSRLIPGIIILVSVAVGITFSCSQPEESRDGYSVEAPSGHQFVGDQTCRSCHAEKMEAWEGSHHDYAMKKATQQSVRGDFGDVTFQQGDESYRFYRSDDKYMVEAPGPEGTPTKYEVTYTFGWTPLQQYLVDYGNGKFQALNVAWDVEKKRWFSLNPDENIAPDDWLHWTKGAMNWNTMCADCHSTNLRQNYIASADSFHTTWSSINVSCEACHGPGKQHVALMQSGQATEATIERIREDLKMTGNTTQEELINQCARCHALREKLTDNYNHKGTFMDHFDPTLPHPEPYFADGQIKEEVYVYGSFLQSKMFHNKVKCTDCHNPHTLKLKANVTDNSLCMQCHESRYNSTEHHFHKMNTEASQCINCHMPGRYYMQIDFRRDHSFRVPRPDLSEEFDTPNACNNCHDTQPPEWAADAVERWYGEERPDYFAETLVRAHINGEEAVPALEELIADTSQPDITRATAIWYLGQFPTRQSMGVIQEELQSPSPLIRNSAVKALATLPADMKKPLLADMLDDPVRAVRLSAIEGLAGLNASDFTPAYRQTFNEALDNYRKHLKVNEYFPQGQMSMGQFYEKRGELDKAIQAYRTALEKDPYFNPARINLAYLLNRRGNNAEAEQLLKRVIEQEPGYGPIYYSLALLLAEQQKLEQALSYFKKAADRMPDNGRVYYNWAIALQTLKRMAEAEEIYLRAIKQAPENPDYRYGIATLYMQQQEYKKALKQARKLAELQPENPQVQNLLRVIEGRISTN